MQNLPILSHWLENIKLRVAGNCSEFIQHINSDAFRSNWKFINLIDKAQFVKHIQSVYLALRALGSRKNINQN